MRQTRKETAWKKSRKFGDVKGGRKRVRLADNIFERKHSMLPPSENEETPIFIADNSSRDLYFPVTVDEIKEFLGRLPKEHTENITHIWLRKMTNKEYEKEGRFQGVFICGNGVNLIILYPFSKSLEMNFGDKKPSNKTLKWYAAFEPELIYKNGNWILNWTEDKIKRYYLEGLLLFEIGSQLDSVYRRFWSKANGKKTEDFAGDYAFCWGNELRNEAE
jgi:hypothetical protein